MTHTTRRYVLTFITTVMLALTFVACGFAVCAGVPQVVTGLSQSYSNDELSPFSKEELVVAAEATRDYTVGTHDYNALMETLGQINAEADTPYADASAEELADAPEQYTLTPDAISHLDDVYDVVQRALPSLLACAVLAAFTFFCCFYMYGSRSVGRPLAYAGAVVIAAFAVLGAWALADFNGLFARFHSPFFADGTWVFSTDSLLICMYPQAFWMGMGAIWLAVTLALSILSLICGLTFIRQEKRLQAERNAKARTELKTDTRKKERGKSMVDFGPGVRVRFAPSPTGRLHVGGARTAIYNWAYARAMGGTFILRIEDTDPERSTEENVQVILNAMKWLGLDWDEGPEVGGAAGPYFQTQRMSTYAEALERLKERGAVYPCFCSKEELDAKRERAEKEEGGYAGYDRTCRDIDPEEAARRIEAGEPHVWRLKVPLEHGPIEFDDAVYGHVSFPADVMDDMIVVRTDGSPTYNFAVVCDDANMGITHVIRGDDHLSNTPRQILIYEALGYKVPTFAHLSMILGPDGKKLSKRHGAASVEEFRDRGYLSDAMVNFLALLGWSLDGETTLIDRDTLCSEFSLERVTKKDAVFDETKLEWMNGQYIKEMGPVTWVEQSKPWLAQAVAEGGIVAAQEQPAVIVPTPNPSDPNAPQPAPLVPAEEALESARELVDEQPDWFTNLYELVAERLPRLDEIPGKLSYLFWGPNVRLDEKSVKKVLLKETARPEEALLACREVLASEIIGWESSALEVACRKKGEELDMKIKNLLQPLRVAVCGNMVSPPLFESIELLPRADVLARIDATLKVMREAAESAAAAQEPQA